MNRIIFIILLLVNTLFSNTLNEVDLKVLKDLNIEPSFLSNRTLQNTFDEYSSGYNISYYNNFIKKSSLNAQIVKSEIENENRVLKATAYKQQDIIGNSESIQKSIKDHEYTSDHI